MLSTLAQPEIRPVRHSPAAASHTAWQWNEAGPETDVGNSALPYEPRTIDELPEFKHTKAHYSLDDHFRYADRLYSDTRDNQLVVERTRTNEARDLLVAQGIEVHAEAQQRRAAYIVQCQRPLDPPAVPEARMLAAINREQCDLSPARIQTVRSILARAEVTPPMVEKQLEDYGLLSAPDYRTQLFDADTREKVVGAILELRYGRSVISSGVTEVKMRRDQALRDHNLMAPKFFDDIDRHPITPAVRPGRVIGSTLLAGVGSLILRRGLLLGLATGSAAACTLLGAAMLAKCAGMLSTMWREARRNREEATARRTNKETYKPRKRALLWETDRKLLAEALHLELRKVHRDGSTTRLLPADDMTRLY